MKTYFEKCMWVAVGLGFIYLGVGLIQSPFIERRVTGYVIDTRGYNVPLGIGSIIFGIVFIYFTIKAKLKN